MLRLPPPRFVAALLLLCTATFFGTPASAQTTDAEAALAAAMRSFSPHLPLARAQAYARSVLADAWRTRLDPKLIMSIVTVESGWKSGAVSRTGARGLGQLMPSTAARLGVNPRNPAENLRGTSTYLKSLMNRFAGKKNALQLAIAGYNAGPKAVERYHGIPPFAETQRYVTKVLRVLRTLDSRLGAAALGPVAPVALAPARTPAAAPVLAPDEAHWTSDATTAAPADAAIPDPGPTPLDADAPAL